MSALAFVLAAALLGATPAERFDSMVDAGVAARRAQLENFKQEWASNPVRQQQDDEYQGRIRVMTERVAYRPILASAPALNQMQTATAIAAAAAAINTSLEGVEAGVSLSPFLLAGKYDWPVQPSVTLAALEGGVTRLGLGLSTKFGQDIVTLKDVRLNSCSVADKKLLAAFEKHRLSYLQVCDAVLSPSAAGEGDVFADAKKACGEGDEPTFSEAMSVLELFAEDLSKRSTAGLSVSSLADRKKVTDAGVTLRRLHLPTPDSCWSDEQVAVAAANAVANATTWNAGLSANIELLPLQWGFAGDSTLTKAEYRAWETRAEVRGASNGREVGASLGFTRAREELGKPLWNSLALQLRASTILASFAEDSVRDESGRVQTVKGELPPHLVVGMAVSGNLALTMADTQVTPFNKLEFMPYVEAHFGEKLAVRLGVPVRALVVTRAAVADADATPEKPAGPELKDLQWSVPATITTVLKLD